MSMQYVGIPSSHAHRGRDVESHGEFRRRAAIVMGTPGNGLGGGGAKSLNVAGNNYQPHCVIDLLGFAAHAMAIVN